MRGICREDISFGEIAISRGLCSRAQLEECLALLEQLILGGVHPQPRLVDLLLEKGYISKVAAGETIRLPAASVARSAHNPVPPEVDAARDDPENVVEKYIRIQRIGIGGMGEVWKAYDMELHRWVALKFLMGNNGEELTRFRREAQAAAALDHPNICPVHEIGIHGDRPFISMQYVDGRTLDEVEWRDRRKLVEVMREVALAVHRAHQIGIIHRDIKPGNLMVDEHDRVFVMDFGLAKQAALNATVSMSGSVVGTPAYMSPEQARGASKIDGRSDVWGLGATMYELLTGEVPFPGDNVLGVLQKIDAEDPPTIRRRAPAVPQDLETIVMKCLEKDVDRRYSNAKELADELQRWLEGDAILAHPPSALYRIRKKLAKRKALFLAVASLLMAVGLAAVILPLYSETQAGAQAQSEAFRLLEKGRPALDVATMYLYNANTNYGELVLRLEEGQKLIEKALERAPDMALAHHLLGRALEIKGYWREAETKYRDALELDPTFAPAHRHLGRLLISKAFLSVDREADLREALYEIEAGGDGELTRTVARAFLSIDRPEAMRRIIDEGLRRFAGQEGSEGFHWLLGQVGTAEQRLASLDEAIRLKPKYAMALLCRGELLYDLNQMRLAERDLSEAIMLGPSLGRAYILRARISRRIGKDPMEDLDAAARLLPEMADVFIERGILRSHRGDDTRALADLDHAIRVSAGSAKALLGRAEVRTHLGDFQGAQEDAESVLHVDPDNVAAHVARANALRGRGAVTDALAGYNRALDLDPVNPDVHAERGLLRALSDRSAEARVDYDRAIELDPLHARAFRLRGRLRTKQGDRVGGVADFDSALKLEPGHATTLHDRAKLFLELNRMTLALKDLDAAVALEPERADIWNTRGLLHFQVGDLDAAVSDFEKAQATDHLIRACLARGRFRFSTKDLDSAIADFNRVLKLDPSSTEAVMGRGVALFRKGDATAALTDFERAVKLNPKSTDAWLNRGRAWEEMGQREEALADFDRVLGLDPSYVKGYLNRAELLRKMGRFEEAVRDYEAALEVVPAAWPHRRGLEILLRETRKDRDR